MDGMTIPDLVAGIRARTGQSQEDLARRLGVSFATVNAWERGRSRPRVFHREALTRLAEDLGVIGQPCVLVIDDDEDACALAAVVVADIDPQVEVITATSGLEGLLVCGARVPDLVLLDVRMPDLDGFAVARALQRVDGLEDTRLLLVTAYPEPGLAERARDAGADGLLTKPLCPTDVRELVVALRA